MNAETIKQLLGIRKSVPLTLAEMGKSLSICFYPKTIYTPHLQLFEKRLRLLLAGCGTQILEYKNALRADESGKVREGIVRACLKNQFELCGGKIPHKKRRKHLI